MFSQRNNPYCELLSVTNVEKYFFILFTVFRILMKNILFTFIQFQKLNNYEVIKRKKDYPYLSSLRESNSQLTPHNLNFLKNLVYA